MKIFLLAALLLLPAFGEPGPASFAYVLQADSFADSRAAAIGKLATCGRDWIVLDPSYGDDVKWSAADLDAIREGKTGRKIIAYVSIGEAEDYRAYWKKQWLKDGKRTDAAPAWLGEENPDWEGNFRVRYWQANWQGIMLPVIAEAMQRGFDGVYLDIVDGFEGWEFDGKEWLDDRINPETKQSYRRDMVEWVKAIAALARKVSPEALVVPQNASQLLEHADFLETISSIGVEDLFTEGNKKQPASHTKEILPRLQSMVAAGKPVLVIEYPKKPRIQELSKNLAHDNHFVWLVTDRDLKSPGESGR